MLKEMNRREFIKASAATGAVLMTGSLSPALAEELKPIQLLKPQEGSGNPLMQLLWKRKSSRQFSPEPLRVEVLSNMLWAAFGINRPNGMRTAANANNKQEIDIYVATAKGLYLYDAKANMLNPILADDIRGMTGIPAQPFVKEAAVNLIYVADYSKMKNYYFGTVRDEVKDLYTAADTGCISENVYLFCASEGLATVVRAEIDRPALASVMKLRPDQKIILAQSVGYPRKTS
jgi:nitroreductase